MRRVSTRKRGKEGWRERWGAEGGAAEMGGGFCLMNICDIANAAVVLVFSNKKNDIFDVGRAQN